MTGGGGRGADRSAVRGLILGMAIGDAVGLPREGLSPRRAARMFGPPPLKHALLPRVGMISDDTEHACMTAQAFLASGGDPERFARALAWRLRLWLLGVPAGVGLATLLATLRLWMGVPARASGVFSAGNGPAMRAPILGLLAGHDAANIRRLITVSTRITHTDPKALAGAMAVATAAAYAGRAPPGDASRDDLVAEIRAAVGDEELTSLVELAVARAAEGEDPQSFARRLGLERGVSGYMYHTVPVALFCWLRHPGDFRAAVEAAITLGGDTDTVGAIVGALCGTNLGAGGIPEDWLAGLRDAPRSVAWLSRLAAAAEDPDSGPVPLAWPLIPFRNFAFAAVVLGHGLRRLLPPY